MRRASGQSESQVEPLPPNPVAIPTAFLFTGSQIFSRARIFCIMTTGTRNELDDAASRMDRARRELMAYIERSASSGFDTERQKLADNLKRCADEYWSLISQLE